MKKNILGIIVCLTLIFACGCSIFSSTSKDKVPASQKNIEGSKSDIPSEMPKDNSSGNTDEDTAAEPETSNEEEISPSIQTTVGYVLSCDGNTIYADLKNTGSRLYPGEGENRKVAFDITNAEQVQTNISEFNSVRDNLICPGIQVTIEYYVENGVNIATKLTSDGDEKEPYSPVAIGKVTAVTDTELVILVTEGDNIGETITFNLSVCDPISAPISVDSQIAVAYYTNQDMNYTIYVGEYLRMPVPSISP